MITSGVIILIVLGIALLLLEFFVVPGTTVAGIGGILLIAGGVYFAYTSWGSTYGTITLASTFVLLTLIVIGAIKSNALEVMKLKRNIIGKALVIDEDEIKAGDMGITISRLAPMGKVRINNKDYEAKVQNDFLDPKTNIKVVKVLNTNLIVENVEEEVKGVKA